MFTLGVRPRSRVCTSSTGASSVMAAASTVLTELPIARLRVPPGTPVTTISSSAKACSERRKSCTTVWSAVTVIATSAVAYPTRSARRVLGSVGHVRDQVAAILVGEPAQTGADDRHLDRRQRLSGSRVGDRPGDGPLHADRAHVHSRGGHLQDRGRLRVERSRLSGGRLSESGEQEKENNKGFHSSLPGVLDSDCGSGGACQAGRGGGAAAAARCSGCVVETRTRVGFPAREARRKASLAAPARFSLP